MQEKKTDGMAITDLNLRWEANQKNGKPSLPTMVYLIYIYWLVFI